MSGRIILIHGASSAGKSTLARAVQARIDGAFWCYSFDSLRDTGVLPMARIGAEFPWRDLRGSVFGGFHRSILAFAAAGNDLIVEHILDDPSWQGELRQLLAGLDVFFVALHLPLDLLKVRAAARSDRPEMAEADFALMQRPLGYDLELDGRDPAEANADRLIAAWTRRGARSGFFGGA